MARTDQTHAEHPEQSTDADRQKRLRNSVVFGVGAILVIAGAAAAIFSSGGVLILPMPQTARLVWRQEARPRARCNPMAGSAAGV